MASKKLPSWQFYPGDWMKDTELRSVSPAARGMWIDLLCLMFESRRRGFLLVNGTPPTPEQITRMTGFLSVQEANVCLAELETSGVFSRTDPNKDGDALIYCRRMVRDEAKRSTLRENGCRGGNPKLHKKANLVGVLDNQDSNQTTNQDPNQKGATSSSTSVKRSPPPARAHVGEQGDGYGVGSERGDPPPYDPPDIPKPLLDLAREVIGLTPEGILTGWMTVQGWSADWITKALMRSSESGKRGKDSVAYTRGILQAWTKNGGPEKDSPQWANDSKRQPPRQEKPRAPAGSRVREMAIALGENPDDV